MLNKSTIYHPDSDSTEKTDETYKGMPFFRKNYGAPHPLLDYSKKVEIAIVKILMEHPHPNIVNYYTINVTCADMEQVSSAKSDSSFFDEGPLSYEEIIEIQQTMRKVKDFLQSLGIMYIDWKYDNLGKSVDGKYKLFDFDTSGLIDLTTHEWILKPQHFWSYNEAIKNGVKSPKEIDDWSLNYIMIEEALKIFQ